MYPQETPSEGNVPSEAKDMSYEAHVLYVRADYYLKYLLILFIKTVMPKIEFAKEDACVRTVLISLQHGDGASVGAGGCVCPPPPVQSECEVRIK